MLNADKNPRSLSRNAGEGWGGGTGSLLYALSSAFNAARFSVSAR